MRDLEWLDRILKPFKQWFKVHVTPYLPGGWRTAALVNTVLIASVSVLLTILSAIALSEAGGFNKPLIFFTGACGIAGALNTTLHIIINILSTATLASSNMFMQVLNAPSREEVDRSHARGSWLEIGVLSGRNIFRLSPFKTIAWLGFLISSIPIHLLFNSAIFEASYRFSEYDLATASGPFLQGSNYFTPGASLLNSGGLTIYDAHRSTLTQSPGTQSPDLWAGYGDFVDLTEYRDNNSAINKKIAEIAHVAKSWTRISREVCKQEYLTCSGLSTHSDVVLVVSNTEGWPRSQVWSLNTEQNSFWDTFVPDDTSEPEHNSLWFYGKCAMSAYSGNGQTICGNSCRWALGGSNATQDWVLPFFPINSTADCKVSWTGDEGNWNSSSIANPKQINLTEDCFVLRSIGDDRYQYADWNDSSIYKPTQNDLHVDYCLARPVQESCKVALSTTLLVCVTGCAILKAILCVWVYCRLRTQTPLTTPGDAINSFISEPDPYTVGMGLVSQGEIRMSSVCGVPQSGPRKYRLRKRKLGTTVPWSEWLFLLAIMISALLVAVALVGIMGMEAGAM